MTSRRKNFLVVGLIVFLSSCASIEFGSGKPTTAVIRAQNSALIISVDGNPFTGMWSTRVSPGSHKIVLSRGYAVCDVKAGYIYEVSPGTCERVGLTDAAIAYQRKLYDADEPRRAEKAAEQEKIDTQNYQKYQAALASKNGPSGPELQAMKKDIESGRPGFRKDPDNLLPEINRRLAPYLAKLEKELKEQRDIDNAAAQVMREQQALLREQQAREKEKQEVLAEQKKQQRLNTWRRSIKSGDTVWRGPLVNDVLKQNGVREFYMRGMIIELKPPIALVQYDGSASFNTQFQPKTEWTKLVELRPSPE